MSETLADTALAAAIRDALAQDCGVAIIADTPQPEPAIPCGVVWTFPHRSDFARWITTQEALPCPKSREGL